MQRIFILFAVVAAMLASLLTAFWILGPSEIHDTVTFATLSVSTAQLLTLVAVGLMIDVMVLVMFHALTRRGARIVRRRPGLASRPQGGVAAY